MTRRIILLTLWSTACLVPHLWKEELNIVTEVYLRAAVDFWNGVSPYYRPAAGDVYQYPPVFAMAYYPLTQASHFVHAVTWCFLNSLFFWWGMLKLFAVIEGPQRWKWLALIFAAVELDISLRYQQVNAMVIGMILLSAVAFYQGYATRAGILMAIATAIKVFPIAIAGAFVLASKRKFMASLVLAGGFLILLPAVRFGFAGTLQLYRDLFVFLGSDLYSRQMYELRSSLERLGYFEVGRLADVAVSVITALLLAVEVLILKKSSRVWIWLPVFLTGFVLTNPRTESPTFVLMAPSFLILLPGASRRAQVWLCAAFFFSTFVYTSVWPQSIFPALTHLWASKSFGVLMVWGYATFLLAKSQWEMVSSLRFARVPA